jgi:hypothetical protein
VRAARLDGVAVVGSLRLPPSVRLHDAVSR